MKVGCRRIRTNEALLYASARFSLTFRGIFDYLLSRNFRTTVVGQKRPSNQPRPARAAHACQGGLSQPEWPRAASKARVSQGSPGQPGQPRPARVAQASKGGLAQGRPGQPGQLRPARGGPGDSEAPKLRSSEGPEGPEASQLRPKHLYRYTSPAGITPGAPKPSFFRHRI